MDEMSPGVWVWVSEGKLLSSQSSPPPTRAVTCAAGRPIPFPMKEQGCNQQLQSILVHVRSAAVRPSCFEIRGLALERPQSVRKIGHSADDWTPVPTRATKRLLDWQIIPREVSRRKRRTLMFVRLVPRFSKSPCPGSDKL